MCFGKRDKPPAQAQSRAGQLYNPAAGRRAYDVTASSVKSASTPSPPVLADNHSRTPAAQSRASTARSSVDSATIAAAVAELQARVTAKHAANPDAVYPALLPYVNRAALVTLLQQDALLDASEKLGDADFDVDMAEGTLTFRSKEGKGELVSRAHLVASIAPEPRSILWGYAHPRGDDIAAALHEAGERDRVEELCAGELPFPEGYDVDTDDGEALAALAHEIGTAAVGITGTGPYYSAPNGQSRVLFLLDTPMAKPTLAQDTIKLPRMLASGLVKDPKLATRGFAELRGYDMKENGNVIEISSEGSVTSITFDELGRFKGLNATMSPAQARDCESSVGPG